MLDGMARDPIVFAMANPDPEIRYEEARAARPDVIMATGRSDYPNQVNNVLGLPVHLPRRARRARDRDQRGHEAGRRRAPWPSWRERTCPTPCSKAYGGQSLRFGREYLIPKPFDYRVLLWVPRPWPGRPWRAAWPAMPIEDCEAYRGGWRPCSRRSRELMRGVVEQARQATRSGSSSPRGSTPRSCAPPRSWWTRGSPTRSCSARREEIADSCASCDLSDGQGHHHPHEPLREAARRTRGGSHEMRRRDGMTVEEARKRQCACATTSAP